MTTPSAPLRWRFRFEKLEVWQESRQLNVAVYRLTDRLPDTERFGLVTQMRRAAISIAANIAEGVGRNSDRDLAHFLELSYGSAMELASHLTLAADVNLVGLAEVNLLLDDVSRVANRIAALNRSLKIKFSKVSC